MNQSISIPAGKFAGEDAAAKKRRELRERLGKGETVQMSRGGGAIANSGEATIEVAKGKLAAQWYDTNPTLFTMEKIAMERNFRQFSST